mmetsp:Transcript_18870/g.30116  ORF Transcript_18870/g.30116 Transcript_18870/m.30116 type:complete len:271 (+) Transcript_18870:556-1368(+)
MEVPTPARTLTVGTSNPVIRTLAIQRAHRIHDLLPVPIADDLEFTARSDKMGVEREDTLNCIVDHWLQTPTIPVSGDKVGCWPLHLRHRGLVGRTKLLPFHHSPLPCDAQANSELCASLDIRGWNLVHLLHVFQPCVQHPAVSGAGCRSEDGSFPGGLVVLWEKAKLGITVEPNLKLLPPVLPQGQGVPKDIAGFWLHRFWAPLREGASYVEASPRHAALRPWTSSTRPENQGIALGCLRWLQVCSASLPEGHHARVGTSIATSHGGGKR